MKKTRLIFTVSLLTTSACATMGGGSSLPVASATNESAPMTILARGDQLLETRRRLRNDDQSLTLGSSRVDLQACKLEYSIVSPK